MLSLTVYADNYVSLLHKAERDVLIKALMSTKYNISATAKLLKMSRNTFYKKAREHGLYEYKGQ